MESEKVKVNLNINDTDFISTQLELFEEISNEPDMVAIELIINGEKISSKSENFFNALINLRKELEKKNILIMCNGAAKNVFPSSMQLSMGSGRKAYKLFMGQHARISDVVDIFDYEKGLDFVNIDEQSNYYAEWLKS